VSDRKQPLAEVPLPQQRLRGSCVDSLARQIFMMARRRRCLECHPAGRAVRGCRGDAPSGHAEKASVLTWPPQSRVSACSYFQHIVTGEIKLPVSTSTRWARCPESRPG